MKMLPILNRLSRVERVSAHHSQHHQEPRSIRESCGALLGNFSAISLLAQNSPRSDNPCYTLRSYQFTPATPGSGAGRITGESTCQPATTIHQKAIVVPAAPAKK
jgi:hypothetical protein